MKQNIGIFCLLAVLLSVLPLFLPSCEKPPEELLEPPETTQTKTEPAYSGQSTQKTEAAKTEETAPPPETAEDDAEAEWDEAQKKHKSDDSLLWLVDFVNSHPNSKYAPEAMEAIEKIREDSAYSEKYLSEPTLDKIDEFIFKFPGHKDIGKAYEQRKEFAGDIHEMMQKGSIAAVSVGDSIMRNVVQIQNNTGYKLEVTIPFGTYFLANAGNVQNMLAREQKSFFVRANQTGILYIDTVCMNIYRDVPGDKNYFTLGKLDENSRLVELLQILDENGSSYEVAQAAVWHMADNPGKDAILGALVYEEGGRTISEADYAEALRLAGLAKN